MRRLNILHTEASDGWGGQEIRILRESLGMVGRGHRVVIAAPSWSGINQRARDAGLRVHDIAFSKKNPMSFLRMREIFKSEEIDVLNTHSSKDSWVACIAARLPGRRPATIRTRHLSTPIGGSLLSRFVYDTLTDAIMTTGEEIRRMMIETNGFRADKIFSVPTGTDLGAFNPDSVKPSLDARGFSVGMVSVLRSWKGHEFFIRAVPLVLREIPEASFYIAGEGPQRDNIASLIRELGLGDKILLLGHREDVPSVIKSLDVVVHPSYANEGVPQGLLQAMAMRKPVVASDAGAIKEVVTDGRTGFLIEPRDPGLIADRVVRLYRDPALRSSLGQAGRKLVEESYSLEAMLDRIEGIYELVLCKRS